MREGHCMKNIVRFGFGPCAVLIDKHDSAADSPHHQRVRSRCADKATSDNSSFHQSSL
jgi:hypothetical protein